MKLLIFLEHLSSPPIFSGIRVARSLVLYLVFYRPMFFLLPFFFCHCIVSPSSTYGFWLPHRYLLAIVLSVLLRLTASDYLIGIFWPLYCQSLFDLRLLITSSVSFGHCIVSPCSTYGFWLPHRYLLAIVLSVLVRLTASDYLIGIFWSLYCQSLFDLRLLITSSVSVGHCIVSPSSTYGFWLPHRYLQTFLRHP